MTSPSSNPLFFTDEHKRIQDKVKDVLNAQPDYLAQRTIKSTRAAGDAIENILQDNLNEILGSEIVKDYTSDFARRAMGDLAFESNDGFYHLVDVKTHRKSTKFNMPNLTSVHRITQLYEEDINYFCLLLVSYDIENTKVVVDKVTFVPIEFVGWSCLTIGALGWGQIQISNSNKVDIIDKYSRKDWMLELCDTVLSFYPKEITKINERINYFESVKEYWESK